MAEWEVECEADYREVYIVEADSKEEAMAKWADGDLQIAEAKGAEPVSARCLEAEK